MKSVYLDNAATTPMLPEVVEVMCKSMIENFGNPSSSHQFGRKAKAAIETARKNIASHFNVTASEIIFTSSGTEADNLILINAVTNLGVKRIVTSSLEHHAVLHTVEFLQKTYNIKIDFLKVDEFGSIDMCHLNELLEESSEKTLVSLMMVNNEIGNVLPIKDVCEICKKNNALFHSDTVQAVGQYAIDLQETSIDFIVASAHKFHGPKGVGFAYFRKGFGVQPMFHGGDQEKGARSSTENVHAILGMEKALAVAYENIEEDTKHKQELKKYLINQLIGLDVSIQFNGLSADLEKSSPKILSVRFSSTSAMFLFNLDLAGVAVSGGSACQSGSAKGSHVLNTFLDRIEVEKTSIRFSFSKFSTEEEVDFVVGKIKNALNVF